MAVGIHRDEVVQRADPAVVSVLADPHLVDSNDIGIRALREESIDQARLQSRVTERLDIDANSGRLRELIDDALQRQIPGVADGQNVDGGIGLGGDAGEVAQWSNASQRCPSRATCSKKITAA